MTFSWTDIEDIVLALDEAHGDLDPRTIRFTDLRTLIESLEDFRPEPGQNVNEQILEAVQAGWIEERDDVAGGSGENAGDPDDDERGYRPNDPFR